MITNQNECFTFDLHYFSKEKIQEAILALLQANMLEQQTLTLTDDVERGYYILIELLKACVPEQEEKERKEGE